MTPQESLAIGTSFLDEATENITFEQFAWAAEEAWRGVAWVLNALSPQPADDVGLCAKGHVPERGTLSALLEKVSTPPKSAALVAKMESLHQHLSAQNPDAKIVEQIVFDAWTLHDACGERLAIADDRLRNKWMLTDVSPGRVGTPVIHRRTALKLFAAGSVLPLQACTKIEADNRPASAVATAVRPSGKDSAPAKIARVTPLPPMQWPTSDPFLFCAYHVDDYPEGNAQMGPASPLDGRHLGRDFDANSAWRMYHGRTVPGFPRHPHRGFETVTVVRSGLLDHSDSMGATARYGGGDVQWLTAGAGIQHAEMFPLLKDDAPNPLELFQIWLNLPAGDKMVDPHFTMLWNEDIPRVVEKDVRGKVVELTISAGVYKEHKPPSPPPNSWASKPESDLAIWTLRMEPGAEFTLPPVAAGTHRSLYVHRGFGVFIAGQTVPNMNRVEIEESGAVTLIAGKSEVEVLLLQGRPIGEPVAKRGPFVMNTQQEIRQAYADYQQTQFGGWPWDANGPVHVRTKGRFARHISGEFEEPT